MSLTISGSPDPVTPGASVVFTASGGIPPYDGALAPAPPNPPGLSIITEAGNRWRVSGTAGLLPGTVIHVSVSDAAHNSADGSVNVG